MIPRATYRIQLSKEFSFDDVASLAPYLAELGISHVYTSPYLKARANSTHGYDITDHNALNPELGGEAAFYRMVGAFESHGLEHILDYVPNHMGVGGSDNPLWLDVLEWGKDSCYANWFDVNWQSHAEYLEGKLLVPFLGNQYGEELVAGKLRLRFDSAAGEFAVWAYEVHKLPISPSSYPHVLGNTHAELEELGKAFSAITQQDPHLKSRVAELKGQLAQLVRGRPPLGKSLEQELERFHGIANEPESWRNLEDLIRQQHWRPAYYRAAADDINYRRFFNINELAGVRMELVEVFEYTHRFVLELLRKGIVDGLRIDHIDGLFDPKDYLSRLRRCAGSGCYLVVEKILARHETLSLTWPIDGTTGYEFAAQVTQLLIDPAAESTLSQCYRTFTSELAPLFNIIHEAKTRIMENEMASELLTLATKAARVARQNPGSADFTQNLFHRAIKEVVACFPVYRTYVDSDETTEMDSRYIRWAIARASKNEPELDKGVFEFLEKLLTCDLVREPHGGYARRSVVELAMKLQQFSGPVMAKGFEDAALFRYNRFAALNEVGSSPDQFGSSISSFHNENMHRAEHWPRTLLTTSTHDTKHSEDARSRLAALSLVPEEWAGLVAGWSRILRARRGDVEGTAPPSRNDEYLFFQNLVATWPAELSGSSPLQQHELTSYVERLKKGMVKCIREARVHSNWVSPNSEYENLMTEFVTDTLNVERSEAFFASFLPFQERIALMGVHNSLIQTVLKLTSPGVPDIYQGCELWDLSMLDPDNRRAVDFTLRRRLLERIGKKSQTGQRGQIHDLWEHWQDGGIKLFLIKTLLAYRRENHSLFEEGNYQPISADGNAGDNICAFLRQEKTKTLLVIVSKDARLKAVSFATTKLPVNEQTTGKTWIDLFTGRQVRSLEGGLPLHEVLAELPVSVLFSVQGQDG